MSKDPAAFDRLRALGAMSTPVVAIGDHWISGAAFDRLDEFYRTYGGDAGLAAPPEPDEKGTKKPRKVAGAVGNIFGESRTVLDERQLGARLTALLDKADSYVRLLSEDMLPVPLPERGSEGRTVGGLCWHLGQVAQDPLRAAAGVEIVKAMHEYDVPADLDVTALADRLTALRLALLDLFAPDKALPDGVAEYFHGPYSFHGLLERTTWHVATHLRQLAWLIVEAGLDPDAGLTADEVADLPMPLAVWK